ncbi:MAG: iron-containing alcohol dehydrogenase, partial [Pseudomonadota bacterium]
LIADLDVIATAPAQMTGWGYADLAGKSPAGGDWLLAELVGAEPRDTTAWPLVQDHLHGWLARPEALAKGDFDATARLFIGLTAVGFAMEFHESSRPASGADHQIAHMWEMEGLSHAGQKVSHGAAVSIGCLTALRLYDWLLARDLTQIDAPHVPLETLHADLRAAIDDPQIAERSVAQTQAKWVDAATHADRLARVRADWPATRAHLRAHLFRAEDMRQMLAAAGAPSAAADIGITLDHLERTVRAAAFIRSRYTILDFLKDVGLFDQALAAVMHDLRDLAGAAE